MSEFYYWYFHKEPDTNEVVYVGIGTRDRAWYCRNRDYAHLIWLEEKHSEGFIMSDLVEVGDTSISRREALEIELNLINDLRPKYNKNFKLNNLCVLTQETYNLAKEMRQKGVYYTQIAKELGVSTMTVHRALTGGTKKYEQFESD